MERISTENHENGRQLLDLDALADNLQIASVGEIMKVIQCPGCRRQYIIQKKNKYAKCKCGEHFRLIERWYEHESYEGNGQ